MNSLINIKIVEVLEGDDLGGRAFALFLRPHPGAFRQLMCPHPLPSHQAKQTTFTEHTTGGAHQQVGSMSPTEIADTRTHNGLSTSASWINVTDSDCWYPKRSPFVGEDSEAALSENASDSEGEGEFSEHIQLALNTSEELINNLGEKFSKGIAQLWSEIGDIKSSLTKRPKNIKIV